MQNFKINNQTQFLTQLKPYLKIKNFFLFIPFCVTSSIYNVNTKLFQYKTNTILKFQASNMNIINNKTCKLPITTGGLKSSISYQEDLGEKGKSKYIIYGDVLYNLSKLIMYSTNVGLTFLLINRWITSGHFPLSNLYESLIFLSWSFTIIYTIVSFTLQSEAKLSLLPTISWCAVPITLFTCGYAFFCVPQELQKSESLVPALQSNWLIMHVSVMILSYASLILGSLFAFSLLLSIIFSTYGWKMLSPAIFVLPGRTLLRGANTFGLDRSTIQVDKDGQAVPEGSSIVYDNSDLGELKYKQNYAIKNHNFLDNLSYRFIGLGFALLTLGIISGAVWANSAWGSYWSWDPKETWAFITWLTYAIYLHLRISQGWYGKQSAYVALFGFFVVWFCYLGVNLFGKGLHSYAFV